MFEFTFLLRNKQKYASLQVYAVIDVDQEEGEKIDASTCLSAIRYISATWLDLSGYKWPLADDYLH